MSLRKRKVAPDSTHAPTPPPSTRKRSPPSIDWSEIPGDYSFKVIRVDAKHVSQAAKATPSKHSSGSLRNYDYADDEVGPNRYQASPFRGAKVGELCYRVEPSKVWLAATRYKKCNVKEEVFSIGDFVYVQNQTPAEDADDSEGENSRLWVAKILEVRAADHVHAWVRIHWMYWPEDLPGGRQPYHAANEVIASNHMDIIDAQSLDGIARVYHWSEDNERQIAVQDLLWRQTYDCFAKKLSSMKWYCADAREINPDELIVQCERCGEWQHASCLEQKAVRLQYEENGLDYPTVKNSKPGRKRKSTGSAKQSTGSAPSPKDLLFTATLTSSNLNSSKDNKITITIRDKRPGEEGKSWQTSEINCLLCEAPLNKEDPPANAYDNAVEDGLETESSNYVNGAVVEAEPNHFLDALVGVEETSQPAVAEPEIPPILTDEENKASTNTSQPKPSPPAPVDSPIRTTTTITKAFTVLKKPQTTSKADRTV